MTMNASEHPDRLRLCEYAGWCQSTDTAWNSDTGKWLCEVHAAQQAVMHACERCGKHETMRRLCWRCYDAQLMDFSQKLPS